MENQENKINYGIIKKFNVIQNENEENNMFISKKLYEPKKIKIKDSQIKFITKKNFYFKIEDTNECKKKPLDSITSNEGRWSKEEHEKFLEGIVLYGINWKKVKTLIGTRTSIQVRSHAQKFFYKMKTCKDVNMGIDFTLNSICNIRDMISQIKKNNPNYNIINIFKYLTYKCDNYERSRKKNVLKNNNNFDYKKNELVNQPNIIDLKENDKNIYDNKFFFNQNNIFNEQKIMKETQNFHDNNSNSSSKMNNQNNIINILHNLLTINYYSNAYNFLLSNNLNFPNYDITNSVNKLLINFLISNNSLHNSLNNSNIINENVLLSLALQNNILNNINNINFIHNIDNNINLKNINCNYNINDISNYNIINNINNENEIENRNITDKINQDFCIYIDKNNDIKNNIDNNNDDIDNKDYNIKLNKVDSLYNNKENNNSPNEKSCLNSNIPFQSI